jgi:hypothetical protein
MNDEFDFESEELNFGEFEEEFDEFNEFDSDEFDDLELLEVNIRTAILQKNNMLALLCVKTATQGGAICRVDPREPNPSVQLYDDPEKAIEWFTKSLRTSTANGWSVVYDGLPLRG